MKSVFDNLQNTPFGDLSKGVLSTDVLKGNVLEVASILPKNIPPKNDKVTTGSENKITILLDRIKWANFHKSYAFVGKDFFGNFSSISGSNIFLDGIKYDLIDIIYVQEKQRIFENNNGIMIDTKFYKTTIFNFRSWRQGVQFGNLYILADSDKIVQLESYLFKSTDDTEEFDNLELIDGVNYSLAYIHDEVIKLKSKISTNYREISEAEVTILDIPIIMWKINWTHASIAMIKWLNGSLDNGGLKIDYDWVWENPKSKIAYTKFLERFHSLLKSEKKDIKELFTDSSKNYQKLISSLKELNLNSSKEYPMPDLPIKLFKSNFDNFIGGTEVGDIADIDKWGGLLGRYRMATYIEGVLTKIDNGIGEFNISNIYYRFSDIYEFSDSENFSFLEFIQGGSQILGVWSGSIYKPKSPSLFGNEPFIQNKDFRSLKSKIGTKRGDFLIYTETRKIEGLSGVLNVYL